MFVGFFFSDPTIKDEHIFTHYEERVSSYTDIHNGIADGKTLKEICDEIVGFDEITTYRELRPIAVRYSEYHYSVNEECDLELAQYAHHHNALAVISNDTDFLIYEGRWQL